jgi:hypothetical protein
MTATVSVRVKVARPADAEGVIGALAERGLSSELVEDEGELEIEIESEAEEEVLATEVGDALAAWVCEHELPFVPVRVDARAFALAPPGD